MSWHRIVAAMALLWCMTVFGGDYTTPMAEAVQSITSIAADPLSVLDSTPTTVTVTVQIAQDPGLIRNSVLLQQFNDQGKVIGSQALYDDGTHGDLHAGDNIFTTQLVLNENAPKILVFRASAAYLKQVKRVSSPTLAIPVLTAKALVQALENQGELPKLDRSSDIQGPDSNANGIRDDVERYIASLPITPEQQQAVEQFAKSIQAALLVDTADNSALRQVDTDTSRALQCISLRFPDIPQMAEVVNAIEKVTANTKERTLQYIKYNNALSGTTATLLTGDTCAN
jgi:hypothetical protein